MTELDTTPYADMTEVAHHDGARLVDDETASEIGHMIQAQQGLDAARHLHTDEINHLGELIGSLTARRDGLVTERTRAIYQDTSVLTQHALRLRSLLADSHRRTDPIYRAALLAPLQGDSNYWLPVSFARADAMGRGLVAFSHSLAEQPPQPVLRVSRDPAHDDPWANLRLDVGFTPSKAGLRQAEGRPDPNHCATCRAHHPALLPELMLPVQFASRGAAVRKKHGEYTTTDNEHVQVGYTDQHSPIRGGRIVMPQLTVPLPKGPLHPESNIVMAQYDHHGVVVEVHGAQAYPEHQRQAIPVVVAVGQHAIEQAFVELREQAGDNGERATVVSMMGFAAAKLQIELPA